MKEPTPQNPEADESPDTEMKASDVIGVYSLFEDNGIQIWIDGGWGVDALLEEQTRPHGDLDIVVQSNDLAQMEQLLKERGYEKKGEEHARPWNYILEDTDGHEIDIHVIDVDEHGNGIYGPSENDEVYPASSLTSTGKITGHEVRCISPAYIIESHSGYELTEKDYRDVKALCERFNIDLPKEYRGFEDSGEIFAT